jgi:hypothetical protein
MAREKNERERIKSLKKGGKKETTQLAKKKRV